MTDVEGEVKFSFGEGCQIKMPVRGMRPLHFGYFCPELEKDNNAWVRLAQEMFASNRDQNSRNLPIGIDEFDL